MYPSCLQTIIKWPQKMHTDTNDTGVRRYQSNKMELPWTLDLLISGDGICIGFYGEDPFELVESFNTAVQYGTIKKDVVTAMCPLRHVML